jgi:hypothetical protein
MTDAERKEWEKRVQAWYASKPEEALGLHEQYTQRFLSDNNRIWTSGALFVPLSFAPFAVLVTVRQAMSHPLALILLAIPSIFLLLFWNVTADGHRRFQEQSASWTDAIERAMGVGPPKLKAPRWRIRIAMARWLLAAFNTLFWVALVIVSSRQPRLLTDPEPPSSPCPPTTIHCESTRAVATASVGAAAPASSSSAATTCGGNEPAGSSDR